MERRQDASAQHERRPIREVHRREASTGHHSRGDTMPREMPGPYADDQQRLDLVIDGATIVDGTGAPGFAGAVGTRRAEAGGTSRLVVLRDPAAIQDALALAHRVIDGAGKVLPPGFIDLHSHSGLMILADPRHEPKVRQGVTTEVVGVDGLGYAPFANQADLDALREMNAGLDGDPAGVEVDLSSVPGHLDRLEGRSLNVATLVGNTPVRIGAIGWEDEPATPPTQAAM